METTLVNKLVDAIVKEWKNRGLNDERIRINVDHNFIKVDLLYSTEEEYKSGFYSIQMGIAKKIADYDYFSSQRIILQNSIDRIIVKPLFLIKEGHEVSLDEQHFTCDTGNIFAKADEVRNDKASFFFVPEPKRNEHPIAELSSFNQLMSALNMSVLICNKLILIHEQIIENDLVAREIFNKYTHSLESKIKEIDVSAFEGLSTIGIQDSSVEKLIKDSIEFLKQFISKVDSDSVWFLSSGRIKDVSIQLNETKIYAQIQLLHAINEYSY